MASFSKIENKWRKLWTRARLYEPDFKRAKNPFYNLMMFPYLSAEGLHIGSVRTFTGIDIYGRFKRMQGYDVFEPIGLDGFGIHSENYALKVRKHPSKVAKITEKNFYRQLETIGNGFAWEEKLETYDPEYYRWTQWIFVQMFKNGLAYRKKSPVNWCPSCKTVLADEQVISGECERCSSKVIKKDLEQWFFKITDYAERLLVDLEKIDWSENVKIAQKNWIGKSEGYAIKFPISNFQFPIEIFTTRPDTLFGATYVVLSPEHHLIENLKLRIKNWPDVERYIKETRNKTEKERIQEKTGVQLEGITVINPANGEGLSVWIADYVLARYGTGSIMAVPAHDERDFEFAKKFDLPIREVISLDGRDHDLRVAYLERGVLINSGKFNGMDSEKAKMEITKFAGGEKTTHYRLRDWLISRQRYWGPPIPMVFCNKCFWQPVPEKDLPVKLPFIKDYRPHGTGLSPLARDKKFSRTKCPRCKGEARRETDVSDTFLDSAWYFFRYLDPKNKKEPFDKTRVKKWLPVHMYIGGAEHAVLHLMYTRFVTKAFKDWGLINFDEPFPKFRAHGLITKDGAKMSKSKGNIVNPDIYIKKFGTDVMRMYLAFLAPFDQGGDFRDAGIAGITRFLTRVRNLKIQKSTLPEKLLHQSIKKITEDIENLHYNTAISQLMILLNEFEKSGVGGEAYSVFLKLLAPFAPFTAEELYQKLKKNKVFKKKNSIHLASWPKFDPKKIREETFMLIIQINGKTRATMKATMSISEKNAEALAIKNENIQKYLEGKDPKKTIFVPNRLINFVV